MGGNISGAASPVSFRRGVSSRMEFKQVTSGGSGSKPVRPGASLSVDAADGTVGSNRNPLFAGAGASGAGLEAFARNPLSASTRGASGSMECLRSTRRLNALSGGSELELTRKASRAGSLLGEDVPSTPRGPALSTGSARKGSGAGASPPSGTGGGDETWAQSPQP
jgi:hypothetical protein